MATGIFDSPELALPPTAAATIPEYSGEIDGWSPESFAREQIRGLVRQVFFASIARPVKQVVFSAVQGDTDVGSVCRLVGEALAAETQASIAVVCTNATFLEDRGRDHEEHVPTSAEGSNTRLQNTATRVRANLWFVPDTGHFSAISQSCPQLGYLRLAELRREFEYSIVQCSPAAESSEASALGQLADGIILVLAAHRTRRATARKVLDTLRAAHVQLLGTVLSDRTFPIPKGLYRRL